eukprot:Seg2224.3 transcript_id=Seg2224.3/GoldUCD/mRNA.D3Y31 product="Tubulin-specific chaperone A" protein_id=Seg2224.3/GoldUCD/D3Y31
MPPQDPRVRQIKIKTGVVKRLNKEKGMYEKEVKDQESKVESMKSAGKDEHEIKQQLEVLNESKRMIPDSARRLRTAYTELTQLLEKETDLNETEDYKVAKDLLQEISIE